MLPITVAIVFRVKDFKKFPYTTSSDYQFSIETQGRGWNWDLSIFCSTTNALKINIFLWILITYKFFDGRWFDKNKNTIEVHFLHTFDTLKKLSFRLKNCFQCLMKKTFFVELYDNDINNNGSYNGFIVMKKILHLEINITRVFDVHKKSRVSVNLINLNKIIFLLR